jgi:hypothetical protein
MDEACDSLTGNVVDKLGHTVHTNPLAISSHLTVRRVMFIQIMFINSVAVS